MMETLEISSRCDFALWAIQRAQKIDLDRPGIAIGIDRRAFALLWQRFKRRRYPFLPR
jgi:hypothetical protein